MLVVCEATGGYEAHVLAAAVEARHRSPQGARHRVRHFARYKGFKAKSDAIDARVLALYGLQTDNLRRYVAPAAAVVALRALQERRHDLQVMLQAETNRLEHASDARVLRSLEASIKSMSKALATIEAEIGNLVEGTQTLSPGPAHAHRAGRGSRGGRHPHGPHAELGTLPRGRRQLSPASPP